MKAGVALLSLVLCSPLALAGADEALPITLAEALQRAEHESPDLLAVRQRALAQAERAGSLARAARPRLSLGTEGFRTDNPARVFASRLNSGDFTQADFGIERLNDPASLSHLSTVLSLELPVDAFGKLSARARAEEGLSRAVAAQGEDAAQEARLRVAQAYQRASLARAALGAGAHALQGARAREADVQARVEAGAALDADLLRVRARRRQREAELAERESESAIACAALGRAIGAFEGTRYAPVEGASAPAPLPGTLAEWQARALASRSAFAAARELETSADWALHVERRAQLPDLVVYAQAQDDRGDLSKGGQSYALGFGVRWSAFDATRSRRVAAAAADARASRLEARAAADQVRLEVESAWRLATSARQRYAAAAGGADEGREALRVIQERRRAGLATLTDELESETESLAAELQELRAATDAALADAALRRAAGLL